MQVPLPCPRCSGALMHQPTARGVFLACGAGCGANVSASVLRQNADPVLVSQMWQLARQSTVTSTRACPRCRKPMRAFHLMPDGAQLDLEACVPCMELWFDTGELARIGARFEDKERPDPERMALIVASYMRVRVEDEPAPREPSTHHGLTDTIFTLIDLVLAKLGWWSRGA